MTNEEGVPAQDDTSKPRVRVIAPIEGVDTRTQVAPTRLSPPTSRTCAYHPSIPAVYICAKCQKPLCINCGVPHGHLFMCPQCFQPPQPVQQPIREERKVAEKPPMEPILGFFGGLFIIISFFMPWASSDYISPGLEELHGTPVTGFTIMTDYSELALVLTMGALIVIVEFLLLLLLLSPTMTKRPPIGVRILPMFLGIIAYVVLLEVVIRAETLASNIQVGWFVCLIGVNIMILRGAMDIISHYKGV